MHPQLIHGSLAQHLVQFGGVESVNVPKLIKIGRTVSEIRLFNSF